MVTQTPVTSTTPTPPEKGKRIFIYDDREFDDPDPAKTADEVRQHFTDFFPELANAETKHEKRGADDVYTFTRRVGTKGR